MPKVSVIMGIYNCADTLQEALDSLYTQTFQDFNIVMCDDGSVDNTYELAQKNQETHPDRIILLRNDKNEGLNKTLNNCLKAANGEYIARMDADDISIKDRFQKQVYFLDSHPEYGFVSTPMIYFDENGEFKTGTAKEKPETIDFVYNRLFCHAPVMIRKSVYDEVNGYTEDRRMLRVEDLNLWFKIYAAGFKGYNIQEPLYRMRDNKAAFTRRKLKYRFNSTYVRLVGYKSLAIPWKYYIYAFLPIVAGLAPKPIYNYVHKRRTNSCK